MDTTRVVTAFTVMNMTNLKFHKTWLNGGRAALRHLESYARLLKHKKKMKEKYKDEPMRAFKCGPSDNTVPYVAVLNIHHDNCSIEVWCNGSATLYSETVSQAKEVLGWMEADLQKRNGHGVYITNARAITRIYKWPTPNDRTVLPYGDDILILEGMEKLAIDL